MAGAWNPAAIAAKWGQAMAGAGTAWLAGINALTQSPTQAAATQEALDAYAAGCAASVQNGRRVAGLNRVDITSYKAACQAKQGNLAVGARHAQPKMAGIFNSLMPVWAAQRAAADSVGGPRGTNSVAKFTAAFTAQMQAVGKAPK